MLTSLTGSNKVGNWGKKIRIWTDKEIQNFEGLIRQSNFLEADKELSPSYLL
jgi:hypothetical protein